MISVNPQFVSETDYHLLSTSVCIDSGVDTSEDTTLDPDGVSRPLDGDSINAAEFDIGAYEYAGSSTGPVANDWQGLDESGIAANGVDTHYATPTLPKGQYKFVLSGSNDADLYVRVAEVPNTNQYSSAGISSTISVPTGGTTASLLVAVNITHTYRGDLRVVLRRGNQSVVLHDRTGGSANNLVLELNVAQFNGSALAGEYVLEVSDGAGADVGVLNNWSITATF